MYRNLSYSIVDGQGYIRLFTWDDAGKRVCKIIKHESKLYTPHPKGKDRTIFMESAAVRHFKHTGERKSWIDHNQNQQVFECLNPKQEYLLDWYYGKNDDLSEFNKHPLRIAYIDIEIAVEDEFPRPEEAKYPINLITVYDTFDGKYHCFSLGHAVINRPDVEFKTFPSEYSLLDAFIKYMDYNGFDVISGWNVFSFDLPYIKNRISNNLKLGPVRALDLSPMRRLDEKRKIAFGGRSNRDYLGIGIDGVSILDYMLLYMKYIIPMEGEKPSYSLNNVCLDELGEGKTEYEGALKHLYKTNFQKFAEYNINDVELIVKLDAKRKFMDLTRMLCTMSLIELEKVFATSALVLGNVLQYARRKGVRIPYNRDIPDEGATFEGAFVKPPEMKRFPYGVTTLDVQSLYPNLMIAFNISMETLVGKLNDCGDGTKELRVRKNGNIYKLDSAKYQTFLDKKKYSVAANGAVYLNDREGLLPYFLKDGFNERIRVKKESKKIDHEMKALKKSGGSPDEIERLAVKARNLDLEQLTRKIILNSTYGVCGSRFSPLYNLVNAEAVTLTGQKVIKMASERMDVMLRGKYKASFDGPIVVYNDTDSMHIDNEIVARSILEGRPFKENVDLVIKEMDAITAEVNKWLEEELPKELPMKATDRLKFVREAVCDDTYYFTKKHYFYHIVDKEGKKPLPGEEFVYKGLQVVQSSYPKFMKKSVKEIFERTVKEEWDNQRYLSYMEELFRKFKTLDFNDIAEFKGLSSYKDSESFLQAEKGATGHGKAALYYNQLIEKLGLTGKYNKVQSGKIRVCRVDTDNEYGIDIIGFDDKMPEEFKTIFRPDYKQQFKKLFMSILNDFCACNKWRQWNNTDDYSVDVMDL